MTHYEIYENALSNRKILIDETIEQFSDILVNLAMSGEYSDINDLFDDGDEIVFDVGDFIKSTDQNIIDIVGILNCLHTVQDKNINN